MERAATVLFSLFFLLTFPIFAQDSLTFDFDGSINTGSNVEENQNLGKIEVTNKSSILFELKHPVEPNNENFLSYSIGGSSSFSSFDKWWFNPDKVTIMFTNYHPGTVDPQFQVALGRQQISDPTGNILDHSLDGLFAELDLDSILAHLGAGYLGLQSAKLNKIKLSYYDYNDSGYFAPQRLIVVGDFSLQQFIPNGSIGLHGGGQFDLRQSYSEKYDSWYTGIHTDGNIIETLEYFGQISTHVGTKSSNATPKAGLLVSSYWNFELPVETPAYVGLNLDYSSGESESLSTFQQMSEQKQGSWLPLPLESLFKVQLASTWQPLASANNIWLRPLELGLKSSVYWNTGNVLTSIPTESSNTSPFYGNETEIVLLLEPASDIVSKGKVGVFLDEQGRDYWYSEFELEISF